MNISQSNRERDYNRVSGKIKSWLYEIKRGHLISHTVDRFKWNIAPKYYHVVDFPTHIDIEVAVSCQMRCPMCRRKQMPTDLRYGMMDFDLYKKIIDESVNRGVYSVKLSWRGEPLLHPKIIQMVTYAKERGIRDVAFLSNGERLTQALAEGLVDAGLDWISISVDGIGETYDRIRWPETSEGILKKVTMLKKYRDDVHRKKPLIRIQTIYAAIKNNPSKYFALWETIGDKVYVIADQARADNNPFPRDPSYTCYEPWRRIVIGWDGIVPNCICDYDNLNPLGDVKTQTIYEIWHGNKFEQLRTQIRARKFREHAVCQECHDIGEMYNTTLQIGNKDIQIGLYKGQELDLEGLDARPKERI